MIFCTKCSFFHFDYSDRKTTSAKCSSTKHIGAQTQLIDLYIDLALSVHRLLIAFITIPRSVTRSFHYKRCNTACSELTLYATEPDHLRVPHNIVQSQTNRNMRSRLYIVLVVHRHPSLRIIHQLLKRYTRYEMLFAPTRYSANAIWFLRHIFYFREI